MLTHGPYEILRHFQGARHFPQDHRLRLKNPGWRILDFEGNLFSDVENGSQRESIFRAPLLKHDRERVFTEDLFVDQSGAADTTLPALTRVLSLTKVLRLGGS